MCLIAGSSMLASIWSKMLGHLCFFRVRKPSSPAKAELLAGVDSKGHLQIFCCLECCWGDSMSPSLLLKQDLQPSCVELILFVGRAGELCPPGPQES